MRVLGLDFETTGLDTSSEAITEIGAVLWDVVEKRPLVTLGLFMWDDYVKTKVEPIETQKMMKDLCGITPLMLEEFGTDTKANLHWLDGFCEKHNVEYIVAHNGENYDKPLLLATLNRLGLEAKTLRALPWLDTRSDIPFASEPDSRKLKHLALDAGFINPFAHRAVFDVLTMLRVMSNYDIEKIIDYSKIPFIVVRAMTGYEERELAKAQRFSWEKIGDKVYPKCWVKRIKADQIEAERAKCNFKVVQIE